MPTTNRPGEVAPASKDRHGLEVMDLPTALDRIAQEPLGRIAFADDGGITILPVNHLVHGTTIVFRTASGSKLDAAILQHPVAFEVDAYDRADHTGWSVLVRGTADLIEDDALLALLEARGLHSWVPTRHERSWVKVRADEISGRQLRA